MISLVSDDTFRVPAGVVHHFNPVEGLDVPALKGEMIEVDGKLARVLEAEENSLSTIRPTHFTLILEFI